MRERIDRVARSYGEVAAFGAAAVPVGLVVGAVCAVFGRVLLAVSGIRASWPWFTVPFLALAGLASVWAYRRWGRGAEKGMGLVFAAAHGDAESVPLRLVPLVMISTWLTHLTGGSAGREGVAVQIGAALAHWLGRRLPLRDAAPVFATVGMAAGFAGLFRTPLAATVFAVEVLAAGRLRYRALCPALVASLVASETSGALGLAKFAVAVDPLPALGAADVLRLLALGICFGVVGGGFAWCLARAKELAARVLPNPLVRVAALGAALSVALLLLWGGRYCGLGTNLIEAGTSGGQVLPWDWALKFALTVATLAAGYQGGEVTPLFSIGASLGAVLAAPLGFAPALAAALGYAAVFGGATNTFLAPVLIGGEVFGWGNVPAFFVVCAAAYLFNMNKTIYSGQLRAE